MKKKILFKMTGSIAAYKACSLISKLVQNNFEVQVVTSHSIKNFIGESTLEGLTGKPVLSDIFLANHAMDHIHLIRSADLIIVCPATANFINKIAHGIGDDLLTTLFLAHDFKKPYLIAPAMNTTMYQHPTTQDSIKKLSSMGITILETQSGVLACGENGWGKLLEPEQIYSEILKHINKPYQNKPNEPLKNKKILITSGGTQEPIDSVRFITNLSTGNTGAFLADQFINAGYDVHYVHGRSAVLPSNYCQKSEFGSFDTLQNLIKNEVQKESYHAVIHLAAVSDYSINKIESGNSEVSNVNANQGATKLSSGQDLVLHLKPNPKILNSIKLYANNNNQIQSSKQSPLVIGFKLTVNLEHSEQQKAVAKLFAGKNVDYVVHNDLSEIDSKTNKHLFHLYQDGKTTSKDCKNKNELFKYLQEIIELYKKEIP